MSSTNTPPHGPDELKRLEQERAFRDARHLFASKTFVEQTGSERQKAIDATKDYGLATVRLLFLLNGGAILSLIAFSGSLIGKAETAIIGVKFARDIVLAFHLFTGGLISAAIISGIGYLNYAVLANSYYDPGEVYRWLHSEELVIPEWRHRFTKWSQIAAVIIAVVGLACFILGSAIVALGFAGLG